MDNNFFDKGAPIIHSRNALFVKSQKWNNVLRQITKKDEAKQKLEEEQKRKGTLKDLSDALKSQWDAKTEKRNVKRETIEKEKILQGERRYKQLKESDDKLRKEQVAKAMHLIQRQKIGPKELESAAILSEVLKVQRMQRSANAERRRHEKQRKLMEGKSFQTQSHQWIADQQKKLSETKKRNAFFKADLYNQCKENERRKILIAAQIKEQERMFREQANKEIRNQIERENSALEYNKNVQKRNAFEALIMKEQERSRYLMEKEIADKVQKIMMNGKKVICDFKIAKDYQTERRACCRKALNAQKTFSKELAKKTAEEKHIAQNGTNFYRKFNENAQANLERLKLLKIARNNEYFKEMEKVKAVQIQNAKLWQNEIVNRLKNEEVNYNFELQQQKERLHAAKDNRKVLRQQIHEKERLQQKQINEDVLQNEQEALDDDNAFLEYGKELIQKAKEEQRTIRPISKAIYEYKKQHELNVELKLARHLISNVPVGKKEECGLQVEVIN